MYEDIQKDLSWLKNVQANDIISAEAKNAILKKRQYIQKVGRKQPLWKDFATSCELLEVRGVRAIKLNYSNLNRQEVEIKLTHKRTCLTYQKIR